MSFHTACAHCRNTFGSFYCPIDGTDPRCADVQARRSAAAADGNGVTPPSYVAPAVWDYTFDSDFCHAEATLTHTDAMAVLNGRLEAGCAVAGSERVGAFTITGANGMFATLIRR